MSEKQQYSLFSNVMITLGTLIFFIVLPYTIYTIAAEAYHFCTCEHTTTGEVLAREYHGRKSRYTIYFSYTSADGIYRQAEQKITETRAEALYPVGSPLKLRYKDGYVFIDNGKENKLWKIIFIPFALFFWFVCSFVLAQEIRNACRFIFGKVARSMKRSI